MDIGGKRLTVRIMTEEEIRAELERRKNIFRREQAALPLPEKVRIAFELSRLQDQDMVKQAPPVPPGETAWRRSPSRGERNVRGQEEAVLGAPLQERTQ